MRKITPLMLATVFLFLAGCNPFAPSLTDDLGCSAIITEQLSPQEVMTNFKFAYNFKDSLVYSDLIDSSFIFISKDFSTNPVTDLTWGRDDELRSTSGLFRNFSILRLDWNATIYELFTNNDSSQVELKQSFLLTLNFGVDPTTYRGEAIFTLVKKGSGRWKIIRWEDSNLL